MGLMISIINISGEDVAMSNTNHPFWVIVNKEISDYVRSWRFYYPDRYHCTDLYGVVVYGSDKYP